jgi:hypothetical protein
VLFAANVGAEDISSRWVNPVNELDMFEIGDNSIE